MMHIPNAIMKTRSSTTCCLLLLLAVPAWGQSPPLPGGGEAYRPLNLSLPRDVLVQPATVIRNDDDGAATRNLRQEGEGAEKRTTHQRYGTGYEARQRGLATESGSGYGSGMNSPMGGGAGTGIAGMGGGGMGGGGHGGMGRGR
jgi:hypothetical protein